MQRDKVLADRLLQGVRACCRAVGALLVCTDGWGSLPQQHQTSVSRKSQKDSRTGESVFRAVAGSVYCDGDQTREETPCRPDHAQDDVGNP